MLRRCHGELCRVALARPLSTQSNPLTRPRREAAHAAAVALAREAPELIGYSPVVVGAS